MLLGCFLGIVSGLTPGLHVNTLAFIFVLSFANVPENIVALIVAMAVTHSFFDFVPSIVLGAPDEESYLSVLPGHRYLLKGQAYKALMLTAIGGLFGASFVLLVSPLFLLLLKGIQGLLPSLIPWLLSAALLIVVLSSKQKRKTAIVVLLSASLGVLVLKNLSMQHGIMAIIIGLFSFSTIMLSLMKRPKLKKQLIDLGEIKTEDSIKGSILAVLGSAISAVLPSMGPNQIAFLLRKIFGRMSSDCYLVLLGGMNTCNLIFSLFVLQAIGKTRTGIALAIKTLTEVTPNMLILFAGTALVAVAFSVISLQSLGKIILRNMPKVSYSKINAAIFAALIIFLLFACGPLALFVSAIACSISLYAALNNVARSSCMAFLIVPTILIYLGL